jgi:dethiobiotin synthetase
LQPFYNHRVFNQIQDEADKTKKDNTKIERKTDDAGAVRSQKKKKDQPKTRPKTITYNQKLKNEINIMMEQYEVQLKEVENRCKRLFDKEYSSVTCDGGGQLAFDIDTTKSKFISFY